MFDRLYQENWLEQVGNDDDEKRSIELEYSLASLGMNKSGSRAFDLDDRALHLVENVACTTTSRFYSSSSFAIKYA